MDKIFINGLMVDTIIGVYADERTNKQPVIIDIEMYCDTQQARASDNILYALDYHQVCLDVHDFISCSSFKLIETLAQAIADKILSYKKVLEVTIKVSKPQALDKANNVGIEIHRKKEN